MPQKTAKTRRRNSAECRNADKRAIASILGSKKANQFYNASFDNSNDAIFLMEYDIFVECNKKTLEMYGCTKEQIIGRRPYEPFSPEYQPDGKVSREKALEKINAVFNGQPQCFEWTHSKIDGTLFEAEVSLSPLKLGSNTYIQAVVRNITRRKHLEDMIQSNEAGFRMVIENLPFAVFAHDMEGNIRIINRLSCKYTGYSREELLEMNVADIDPDIAARKDRENICLKLELGGSIQIKGIHRRKDSTEYSAEITISAITFKGERLLLTIVQDITERQKSEEALRENEEKIRSIFRAAPIGIGLVSNRVLLEVNDRICEMTGYSKEELIGQNSRILYPSDAEYELVGKEKYKQIRLPGTSTVETFFRRKDGNIVNILLSSTALNPDDLSCGVTFTALDITERKKTEAELLLRQEQLESLASELAMAEEQERHRIAVGIHDDVGAKIALAKLEIQTLLKSITDTSTRQSLNKQIETIDQIINDVRLLTFELSDPVLYEIGLEAAVESWMQKNISEINAVKWELLSEGPKLNLDNRIKITLFKGVKESVTNVLKHSKASRLIIFIKREKGQIVITVEDNGIGFDTSILAKSKLDKGSFGLFYLKERLNYLGGQLEICSQADSGTLVKMAMPLKE